MSSNVELVMFYGPPFIGKTLYYFNHYGKTHSRVSASEIFKDEKCSSLRLVILKVIALLEKGKNVVIDDLNWYIATRQSYTSLVKKKVPNCRFTVVQFLPDVTSGYQQCLWAREWELVEQTLLENNDYSNSFLTVSEDKLNCWFERKRSDLNPPELPAVSEGFSIVTVKPQLVCGAPYNFNLAGLFIQWQSIVSDVQNEHLTCKSKTPEALNKWVEKNHSGRIIIIGPKMKNNKDIVEERTKRFLLHLASQLVSPLYFVFIDERHQVDEFSRLPEPGVLAFLQKFHTIDLYHKATMYIYSSDDHQRAASSLGIRTMKATKLFNHPHLIDSVYCGETASSLCFPQNIVQVACCKSVKQTQGVLEPQIPFFSRAREGKSLMVWKYCYGKVSGICFKDKEVLERYQMQYKLAARPSQSPGKAMLKSSRSEHVTSTPIKQPSKTSSASPPLDARLLVANIDLQKVAETTGRYLGGFQCRDNVFDLDVKLLEQRLKISCKCRGSGIQPYDVQVMLSDSAGLLQAHCSCPDVAGKSGRCKHVIGLLLNYKDDQRVSGNIERNKASCSTSSKTKTSTACCSISTSGSNKHRVGTLYCMSQEELLYTAKEILKKDIERQTAEQILIQETDNNSYMLDPQQRKRSTVDENQAGEAWKEFMFFDISKSGKSSKRHCISRTPNFTEDTPSPDLQCTVERSDSNGSAIIPDTLVRETISSITETIHNVSTFSTFSCAEEPSPKLDNDVDSFEAFLDKTL